jgi:hypothetical protein
VLQQVETHLRGHSEGMVVERHPGNGHRIGAERPGDGTRPIGHLEALRGCLWSVVSGAPSSRRRDAAWSYPHSRKVLLESVPRVRWFPHSAAVQLLHCVSAGESTSEGSGVGRQV